MNKNIIAINLLMLSFLPVCPIQKRTANIMAGAVIVATAAASYQAQETILKGANPFFILTGNVLFGAFSYSFFQTFTPEGRLKEAQKELDAVCMHKLAVLSFDQEAPFFSTLHDLYLTCDLPLIRAYSQLIELLPAMDGISLLLEKAGADIPANCALEQQHKDLSLQAKTTFENISQAIRWVREHKDYLTQLQIYKEFLAQDKNYAIQVQMAAAQTQSARAQSSATRLKWLQAIFGFGK